MRYNIYMRRHAFNMICNSINAVRYGRKVGKAGICMYYQKTNNLTNKHGEASSSSQCAWYVWNIIGRLKKHQKMERIAWGQSIMQAWHSCMYYAKWKVTMWTVLLKRDVVTWWSDVSWGSWLVGNIELHYYYHEQICVVLMTICVLNVWRL